MRAFVGFVALCLALALIEAVLVLVIAKGFVWMVGQ